MVIRGDLPDGAEEPQIGWQQLVDGLDEGVILVDRAGRILRSNPSVSRITGVPSHQLVGSVMGDLETAFEDEQGRPLGVDELPWAESLRTGRPLRRIVIGGQAMGWPRRWVSVSSTPLFEDGVPEPNAVVVSMTDITDAKERTDDLATDRDRMRNLLRSGTDAIVVYGPDGVVKWSSPEVERVLGIPLAEFVGSSGVSLLHPAADDDPSRWDPLWLAGGRVGPFETRIRTADGRWRLVEAVYTNLLDDPDVAGIVVNARDVSGRYETVRVNALLAAEADILLLVAGGTPSVEIVAAVAALLEQTTLGLSCEIFRDCRLVVRRTDGHPLDERESALVRVGQAIIGVARAREIGEGA